jgi:hypothetical protein
METLQDIEYKYISDIVKFFCKSYVELVLYNKPNSIQELIMKQLDNRLVKSSIVNDYRVSTNILSTIERRDLVLDNLVNDADNDIEEHVDVYIEHRRGIFYSFRYNLKDSSFIVTP